MFATRTSDCQCELIPSRCPTEPMISAFCGGVPPAFGVTGVTRLIETGAPTVVTPWLLMVPLPGVVTSKNTVPVNVPLGRPVGSAKTIRSTPSGGSTPMVGCTRTSHGLLSSCAGKGRVWTAKPGMCTGISISPVLPTGTGTFGLVGATTGAMTTLTTTEFDVKPLAHGRKARTR